ncbi:MAG: DUF2865 domain-containing protein [Hyphomicrobiaceae bacterium]|nr:DUF2865 domain-containing protein [Hyphomicrobiaceae bacterium]
MAGLTKKMTGLVVVVILAIAAVALSAPRYAPAKAGWLDKIFSDFKPRTRKRVRSYRARPVLKRSRRNRHIRTIGRIDRTRPKAKRKKSRTYRIPRSKTRRKGVYGKGTYRTMCVRTCDGFFFPVSFSTTKGRMKKDANLCASRCGAAPARLYYYANPGSDIKDMVSYKGKQKYKNLKNAFLFTKKFVADCRCKPEPWTKASRNQHKSYALLEAKALKKMALNKKRASRRRVSQRRKARRKYRRTASRYVRRIGAKKRARRRSRR